MKEKKNSEVKSGLYVKVHDNNINRALQDLRGLMAREGWVKDVKRHAFFESKGTRKRKRRAEAIREARKELREQEEQLTHDKIHHASAKKRGGTRRARRLWDRGEGKFKKKDENNDFRSYSDYIT